MKILTLAVTLYCVFFHVSASAEALDSGITICVPISGLSDPISQEVMNFSIFGTPPSDMEGKVGEVVRDTSKNGESFRDLEFAIEERFPNFIVEQRGRRVRDCSNKDAWNIRISRTISKIETVRLCLVSYRAQATLEEQDFTTNLCQRRLPGLTLTSPVNLRSLVHQDQDVVFRRGLGISDDQLKAWQDHLSYVVMYDEADLENAGGRLSNGQESARQDFEFDLRRRAVMLLSRFPSVGLVPGAIAKKLKDDDGLTKMYKNLPQEIAFPEWRASEVLRVIDGKDLLVIVRLNEPQQGVGICVPGDKTNNDGICAPGDGKPPVPKDQRFKQDLNETYLRGRQQDRLLASRFNYPAQRDRVADIEFLDRDPRVSQVKPDDAGRALFYQVTPSPDVERTWKLSFGVEYSSADGAIVPLTVNLVEDESNRIQELSLALEVGEKRIAGEGRFAYSLLDTRSGGAGTKLTAIGSGTADRDEDARFGNVERGVVTAERQIVDLGLHLINDTLTFDQLQKAENIYLPMPIKDRPARWSIRLEGGVRYMDVFLKGDEDDLIGLDSGSSIGPYLTGRIERSTYLPFALSARWLGLPTWETDFDLYAGLAELGDDSFIQSKLQTGLRTPFFLANGRDGYSRFTVMGGWVSKDAPTYAYLDVSDPRFLEGFGKQEVLGREFYGVQAELGLNISALFSGSDDDESLVSENEAENTPVRTASQSVFAAAFAGVLSD